MLTKCSYSRFIFSWKDIMDKNSYIYTQITGLSRETGFYGVIGDLWGTLGTFMRIACCNGPCDTKLWPRSAPGVRIVTLWFFWQTWKGLLRQACDPQCSCNPQANQRGSEGHDRIANCHVLCLLMKASLYAYTLMMILAARLLHGGYIESYQYSAGIWDNRGQSGPDPSWTAGIQCSNPGPGTQLE